jgi:hypothetical protein
MNKTIYYRVYDLQTGQYFATGYNTTSIEELINDFKEYISMANECEDIERFTNWGEIEEYLQGVELEKSETKFEENTYWTDY